MFCHATVLLIGVRIVRSHYIQIRNMATSQLRRRLREKCNMAESQMSAVSSIQVAITACETAEVSRSRQLYS